jgi:hypothetical protein
MAAAGKSRNKTADFKTAFMRIPRDFGDELRFENRA